MAKASVSKPAAKAAPAAKKAAPVKTAQATATPAPAVPVTAAKKTAAKLQPKAAPEPKEKAKKAKLVRDSFTMPEAEYAALGEVKKACLKAGVEVKKSELLRIGVALVRQLDMAKLKEILAGLPTLKAGRPKKSK